MIKSKKYVVDTNALISSVLIPRSISARAIDKAILEGTLYFTNETFAEFEEVLFRKKFDKYFSSDERINIIERLAVRSVFIDPTSNGVYCRDPKDDKFLNLAIDMAATCIITGDDDLLVLNPFKNIPILKASDFINAL